MPVRIRKGHVHIQGDAMIISGHLPSYKEHVGTIHVAVLLDLLWFDLLAGYACADAVRSALTFELATIMTVES